MKGLSLLCLLLTTAWPSVIAGKQVEPASQQTAKDHSSTTAENVFDLTTFGAVGDGVTDDGPALQSALAALAEAGGGTLFVPAGRYAIVTPVQQDFAGLATPVSIIGVPSFTPAPPPNAFGQVLSRGLDLVSEFAPRTGPTEVAISLSGLQILTIKDITFIGTAGVDTDARTTLILTEISDATISHCEFYGLSSLVAGGSVLQSVRSNLKIEESVFLGDTCNSGVHGSVVQNTEWKSISVSNSVFVDYGQRPELYGKLNLAAPYSWVYVGSPAPLDNTSPRREAVFRNVFFDEGAVNGLMSVASHQAGVVPVDLFYVSGLYMNVSNLNSSGNYLDGPRSVLIENAHYGWSHAADAAINILGVGHAILDQVECNAGADRIRADAGTARLTVIDSVYGNLDSAAPDTRVITTADPDDDAVLYVREQFNSLLGRDPDPAAHFYWSDRLLGCGEDAACVADQRAALRSYLDNSPAANFAILGRVTDEAGVGVSGATVSLSGAQSVNAQTNDQGEYAIANLPTSGVYTISASRNNYTISIPSQTVTTPSGDQTLNFAAVLNRYQLVGRVVTASGQGLSNVTVILSGSQSDSIATDASGNYGFIVPAEGNYQIVPVREHYSFNPSVTSYNNLSATQATEFAGALVNYTIRGRVTSAGEALSDVVMTLSGAQSGSTTTDAAGNYSFSVPAEGDYSVAAAKKAYVFSPQDLTFNGLSGNETADFAGVLHGLMEFSAPTYSVSEDTRTTTITVTRAGDITGESEVIYSGIDGSADQHSDVIPIVGRLTFAPEETSKSFIVFITNDAKVEGNENLTLQLTDPRGGIIENDRATLSIVDDDTSATNNNPIDNAQFFVRQHYRDFLNRPADAAGLAFWSNQITSCGSDAACIADRRMNVSAAFFLSIEFQETGFLVYRFYKASFAEAPEHLNEFLLDTRTIAQGLVVNTPGWQELLEANKVSLTEDFVTRARFIDEYPLALTPAEFVMQLNAKGGYTLTSEDFTSAVAEFGAAATSADGKARARVLRRVAESTLLTKRELNPAFVLMQYFGYLQRNPSDPPDTSLAGYNFWLNKLNEFDGDFRRAEMVKSFVVSGEYRGRFGTP